MVHFIELIFFHIYKSLIKSPDELYRLADKSYPSLVALIIISVLGFANILTITMLLEMLESTFINKYLYNLNLGRLQAIIIVGVLFAFNYFILFNEDKYKKVIKEFSKKPLPERKKGARITLIYGLGSIALVFIFAFLR